MNSFVFFDVGGTLIAPYPSVAGVYRSHGLEHGLTASEKEIQIAFKKAWKKHEGFGKPARAKLQHDEQSTQARWKALVMDVFEEVNFHGDSEACFMSLYNAFTKKEVWTIFDDVLPTLEALKQRNVRAGIISNWDLRLPNLLDTLELSAFFDPIIISSQVGVEKPKTEIFEIACKRANVKKENTIYIGDQIDFDVHAPMALGLRAFLIERAVTPSSPHSISSLTEVLKHL